MLLYDGRGNTKHRQSPVQKVALARELQAPTKSVREVGEERGGDEEQGRAEST